MKLTLTLLTALLLAPLAAIRAADFHVAPEGLDSNPGTAAAPFATLYLARWLAGRMPAERLLLTTGNPDESRWSELVASGFTTLRKPVTAAMLDEWVGGWTN